MAHFQRIIGILATFLRHNKPSEPEGDVKVVFACIRKATRLHSLFCKSTYGYVNFIKYIQYIYLFLLTEQIFSNFCRNFSHTWNNFFT